MKLLILDKDGTLTSQHPELTDNGFVTCTEHVHVLPGALAALERYIEAGWYPVICTNQGGITRGYLDDQTCLQILSKTMLCMNWLIHEAIYCPHLDHGDTATRVVIPDGKWIDTETIRGNRGGYRKPNPGMINFFKDCYNPDEILFVGDSIADKEAAKNADVNFLHADLWRNGNGDP